MKAIITQKDGLFLVTLMNDEYKDIFVVDEVNIDLAEWIAKEEVNHEVFIKW